jgi:transcriptional regulator with XRE-family HTH domain
MKGYSQDYMAMQLEMTQPGYSKIESGITTTNVEKLSKIASILEVDITDLLRDNQSSVYFMNNKNISNAYVEHSHNESKDVYEKLIKKQEEEISFLRKMLERR